MTADRPGDYQIAFRDKTDRLGKSCFNFATVNRKQLAELKALAKTVDAAKTIEPPWARKRS